MTRRRARAQSSLAELLVTPDTPEGEFQKIVIREAVACGWLVMHVLRSQVGGYGGRPKVWVTNTSIEDEADGKVNKGWPDLTMIHPAGRLLFIELKGPKGYPSPEQKKIIRLLQIVQRCSFGRVKAAVVRPDEWPTLLKLLRAPGPVQQ